MCTIDNDDGPPTQTLNIPPSVRCNVQRPLAGRPLEPASRRHSQPASQPSRMCAKRHSDTLLSRHVHRTAHGRSSEFLGPICRLSNWARISLSVTIFGLLILRKIIKIVATRCHILRLKCTKFDFRWSSAPDPTGEAHCALSRPPSTV